jgi:hypothetical protein
MDIRTAIASERTDDARAPLALRPATLGGTSDAERQKLAERIERSYPFGVDVRIPEALGECRGQDPGAS